jgi:hypothetical protein
MSTSGGMSRARRALGTTLAIGAAGTLLAAGCTRPGGGTPWPTTPPTTPTTTPTSMPGMDHGDGGMDHGDGATGEGHHIGYDHAPTAAQQAAAKKFVTDTRAAVRRMGLTTPAALTRAGYFTIGDAATGTNHFVMNKYHYDSFNLDPNHVEAFAVRNGRVVAAMYILSNGSTAKEIPDLAGNWTQWHNHTLPFRSNIPTSDDYYRLGGRYTRVTAPMLHVWVTANSCGPFTGTDNMNMTGSCHPEAEPGTGYLY